VTDWDPDGIVVSDAFRSYVGELRESYNYAAGGVQPDSTTHMSDTQSDSDASAATNDETSLEAAPHAGGFDLGEIDADSEVGRRVFMATTAAATATLALGAGSASAVSGLNFDGPVPNPTLRDTVTIAEHNREDMSSVLEYLDDRGNLATLEDYGGTLDTGDDSDSPVNPVTLRPDKIDAYDFYNFPKDETYTDGDGDEQDLNALERPGDWSTSSSSIVVEQTDTASGAPALRVAGSGIADGGTETATFSPADPVGDGLRKVAQIGVNVNALPSGSSAIVRVTDDSTSTTVDLRIDPSADAASSDVIATETTTGTLYQTQFGELVDTLDQIDSVIVEVNDGDVDLDVWALNLERSSKWELGTREYTNSDDELDTETVYEPNGTFSVVDLDTVGDVFGSATFVDVAVDVELETAGVADDVVEYEFNDLDHPNYNREMRLVVNRELPTGYDLSWTDPTLVDVAKLFGEQYATLDLDTDRDDDLALEDVDDTNMVDRSDAPGDRGDEYGLAASTSPGLVQSVYYRLRIDSSTEENMKAESGAGGRSGASGGGGFFSSARGMLVGATAGVAAFFGIFRSRIFG